MAATILSVEDKLRELYQLQIIDSKIDEIQILKGELPIEVSDLEDEIVGLQTRIDKLNTQIEEINFEVSKHNMNIKESEALILRYEKQLDEVKNNREYDALSKEIELQKLEIQLSEKRIGEFNLKKQAKTDMFTITQDKTEAKKTNLENKKVELDKILTKTEKQEKTLTNKSKRAQKGIEDRLLKSYKRTRESYRNGLSVVTIKREACGGCFNRIPPQLQIEIGTRKNIIACEHCGRVLVDNIMASEIEGKM